MECTRQRLSKEVVEKVEELLEKKWSYSKIVKETKVSKGSISKIKNGTYKKAPLIQESINEKEYAALKEKYIELNKKYTQLSSSYINIYRENIKLKRNNKYLRKYTNDLKRFEVYIKDLGNFTHYLMYNRNFNKPTVQNHYHDFRSINLYSNNTSTNNKPFNNNSINNNLIDFNPDNS
ncbi:MAG: hypothetical protein Q4B63_11830 [Clostridium perfringens]|nr:hypothetical protein [Clostridium perfringens]